LAAWLIGHGIETDVAGNSLAAHWTKIDEHRPISGILPVPPPPAPHPVTLAAAGSPQMSPAPAPNLQAAGGGLAPNPDASTRIRVWVHAAWARSAAQILAAAAVTAFVLFLGSRIGANLPARAPVAPRPRPAAPSKVAHQSPPDREANTIPVKQNVKPG